MTILALVGGTHFSTQLVDHELQPITDAEHRQSEMQDTVVSRRCIDVVNRRRPTGQHNTGGTITLDFVERSVTGKNDGEDALFADAARDELRILRTKVEDDDRLSFHYLLCQTTPSSVKRQTGFGLDKGKILSPSTSQAQSCGPPFRSGDVAGQIWLESLRRAHKSYLRNYTTVPQAGSANQISEKSP